MPDIVNLIIWLIAGVAGGNAAGELLKGDYDLGPGNTVAGAIGGIVGALILQTLIPALRGIDFGPIIGQVIVAAASGAVLTVIAGAVQTAASKAPISDFFGHVASGRHSSLSGIELKKRARKKSRNFLLAGTPPPYSDEELSKQSRRQHPACAVECSQKIGTCDPVSKLAGPPAAPRRP